MYSKFSFRIFLIVLLVAVMPLTGCGGGSVGTDGGGELRVAGFVVSPDGGAFQDATVIIEETGDRAQTANDGAFEISTIPVTSGHLLIEGIIDSGPFSIRTGTVDFTENNEQIRITVSIESGSATVESISIEPIAKVTPRPDETTSPVVDVPSLLKGQVNNFSGQPIRGLKARIAGEVESATQSDGDGRFSMQFSKLKREIVLVVSFKGQSTRIRLADIPKKPVAISIQIKVPDFVPNSVEPNLSAQIEYTVSVKPR